jgi:pimeloyl-ACP methyl ester carboxylesterase
MTEVCASRHVDGLEALAGFEVRHRFVDVRGTTIHVLEAGDPTAPALLCIHGWPQHADAWAGLLPELAAGHRVLCPDLYGFGRSAPMGLFGMTRLRKVSLAKDLAAVLDALGVESVAVVAHDWGCWVASHLAWRLRKRVTRLVLLAGVPPRFRTLRFLQFAPKLNYTLAIAAPIKGGRMMVDASLVPVMLRKASPQHTWTPEELARYTDPISDPARARASTWLYRWLWLGEAAGAVGRGLLRILPRYRLRMPTLLLLCDTDPVMTDAIFGRAIREDVTVEQVHAGHFVLDENPPGLAARILAFIAS